MMSPHILNSHIMLKNTRAHRLLVEEFLNMALRKPRGFCHSEDAQDQLAWTILVLNHSLPLVNPNVYEAPMVDRHGNKRGPHPCSFAKIFDFVIGKVRRGAYEIVEAADYDSL